METLTADRPQPAQSDTPPPGTAPNGSIAASAPSAPSAAAVAPRACARCGSPLAEGQDWCLQCGSGAPGSLGTPGWRPAGMIAAAAAVLVLLAAAAGYAALSKPGRKPPVLTTAVAAVTPPAAATPPAATPPPVTPAIKTPLLAKPPKIPLTAATPKPTTPITPITPVVPRKASTTPTTPSSSNTGGAGEESKAILLDTNAASTYNPYNYPAASFGDPSLAIDGDSSTGWTAQVNPAMAPKMADGLVIDLKSPQKVASLALITSTPGFRIQVYGSAAAALPTSITDPAWVQLSRSMLVKKRHQHVTLSESKHPFRFVTLWISSAPAGAVGTPQAPAHVTVDELELFPG